MGIKNYYEIYSPDGKLCFEGDVSQTSRFLGISNNDMVSMYARSGRPWKGYAIKSIPTKKGFILYDGENEVARGLCNALIKKLLEYGITVSESTVFKYAREKRVLFDRFKIVPIARIAPPKEKKHDYINECLDTYGNTIICGIDRESVLEQLKTKRDVTARKIKDDSRWRWHYLVEVK